MVGFQQWWSALYRARKLMLGALVLMTLSQFIDYQAPDVELRSVAIVGGGSARVVPNFATGAAIAQVPEAIPGVTGWTLHPYAWLVLGVLLLLFVTGLDLGKWWQRWGYWTAAAGLAFCIFPFDMAAAPGWGLGAGLLAIAIGLWATRVNSRASKVV